MIDDSELERWARRFGVSPGQVRRDHFISHVLRAVGQRHPETRFFGGTALCRTHLDQARLSEDIDLLHPEPRSFLATLNAEVPTAIRREYPDTTWSEVSSDGDGFACSLEPSDLAAIKVYVGYDRPGVAWEFAPTQVSLRYQDLPVDQVFQCPTVATFAAMKLAAWSDRHAPRDLFDLAGLADLGTLHHPDVSRILRATTGVAIVMAEFARLPARTAAAWETELGAQVGVLPSADDCLDRVRTALAARSSRG